MSLHVDLFKVICGSHLYGLQTENSDIDYGVVICETAEQIFGISHVDSMPKKAQSITNEEDVNYHYLRKWAYLCAKGNPNVVDWLWASKEDIIYEDPHFRKFLKARSLFLGMKPLAASHFGFAKSQIIKMRAIQKAGEARRGLVAEFGYDTKFASHAARLMIQMSKIANDGLVEFPLCGGDRDIIMDIKTGKIPSSKIDGVLMDLRAKCDADIERNAAKIPDHPDIDGINTLLTEFYQTSGMLF